jgi:predicted TIM-barrel fold metal-dependent hydrolase
MKNILFLVAALTFSSCSLLYNKVGGDFKHEPHELNKLSPNAKKLVDNAFKGLDMKRVVDTHLHVVGLGKGGTGVWVNPAMSKWWRHPGKYNRFRVYLSASGVKDQEKADQQYVERLVALHKNMPKPFKSRLLAFDYHYNLDGTINWEHSEFHVPNEYVWSLHKKYPQYFVPVISVHPYRKDAIKELTKWAKKGVRFVKWLPNAMGMDPASKRVTAFYKTMKKYNMVLISHGGEEKAVEGEQFQELGNPQRLKLPLDLGVKVQVSHLSSRGHCKDHENGDKLETCSKLFWRMFRDRKYRKNLFSEMSSLIIFERLGEPLDTILAERKFYKRVGYGSDYPLPAINFIYRTGDMVEKGYINEKEAEGLNEIYGINPLLFNFVAMRTLKHPKTGKKLPAEAFYSPRGL